MTLTTRAMTAALALMVALTACEPPAAEDAAEATAATGADETARMPVTFTATEYAYDGPDSIPAGMNEIEFVNNGKDSHSMLLIGYPPDKTMDDVMAALETEEMGPWMTFPGGIGGIEGGARTTAVLDVPAGEYVMMSFESAPGDDLPDVAKGMIRGLTVTPSEGPGAPAPAADDSVSLADYSFAAADVYDAGSVTLEVVNKGTEPHEAIVLKLAEGVTAKDFVAMASAPPGGGDAEAPAADTEATAEYAAPAEGTEASGDDDESAAEGTDAAMEEPSGDAEEPAFDGPPVTAAGGMGPLNPGSSGFVTLDLDPGRYMFICFVPNAEGTPHMALGMFHEFSVQ
jgi:hypothetical protein